MHFCGGNVVFKAVFYGGENFPLFQELFCGGAKSEKAPKPFRGSGAIGLQTARKPNSVLDDHSSTRRITAAL